MTVLDPRSAPQWEALGARARQGALRIRVDDADWVRAATLEEDQFVVDFSKNLMDPQTQDLLLSLAERVDVYGLRDSMFRGEKINVSEGRSVLHTALRAPSDAKIVVDGVDIGDEIREMFAKMESLAVPLRDGLWRGATGAVIDTVVNIGIGGSDLGPKMVTEALADFGSSHVTMHFLANVDPAALDSVLAKCDPARTLFIVSSKTFGTAETLSNARGAREFMVTHLGDSPEVVKRHFIAVSTNLSAVAQFGVDPGHVVGFGDYVGGRYSVDSAIGLSVMVAVGPTAFYQFLSGLRHIDEHFLSRPPSKNIPVLMGLHAIWYRDFLGAQSRVVLPYAERLASLPAYLQQLEMESNGKSVRADGTPVGYDTSPVIWGEPGTDGQHAFYQMLHQGTSLVPADFLLFATPARDPYGDQDLLVASGLAQSRALAKGRSVSELKSAGCPEELVAHRMMPGNRPSTTFLFRELSPYTLGEIIALYEHSVFVQGAIWGIDSFDQWGVELGKEMARDLIGALSDGDTDALDPSTSQLVARYREMRGRV